MLMVNWKSCSTYLSNTISQIRRYRNFCQNTNVEYRESRYTSYGMFLVPYMLLSRLTYRGLAPAVRSAVPPPSSILSYYAIIVGARGSLVVKVLHYKSEGRGFETRWSERLNLPNPSGRTRLWVHSASNRNEY
jgi:hypothetical protein